MMTETYANARRIYIDVTTREDTKDEEYEEEMRSAIEEIKREEEKRKI